MLLSPEISLGERWAELVELWAAFEKKEGFAERGKLPPNHRPQAIGEWIQRARSPTWRPDITNIPKFEKDFRAWWLFLQPKWWVGVKGTIRNESIDGNWDALWKPGLNGVVSLLAALFYWGRVAQKNAKHCEVWVAHVEECIVVLHQLTG